MKQRKANSKREFEIAFAYYKKTVWEHVGRLPLTGTQYDVARCAFDRVATAHRAWSDSLDWNRKAEAASADIQAYQPRRLEKDDTITPEILAKLASARLGTRKPKSLRAAAEEAHQIFAVCRDYLQELPPPQSWKDELRKELQGNRVSFDEIEDSSHKPDCFPFLPTVQAKRNGGKITKRAREQALKRYALTAAGEIQQQRRQVLKSLPAKSKEYQRHREAAKKSAARRAREIRQAIREALKNKAIPVWLLEKIRFDRFRRHFEPR